MNAQQVDARLEEVARLTNRDTLRLRAMRAVAAAAADELRIAADALRRAGDLATATHAERGERITRRAIDAALRLGEN